MYDFYKKSPPNPKPKSVTVSIWLKVLLLEWITRIRIIVKLPCHNIHACTTFQLVTLNAVPIQLTLLMSYQCQVVAYNSQPITIIRIRRIDLHFLRR